MNKNRVSRLALSVFLLTLAAPASVRAAETVVHQGTWSGKSFKIRGTWTITRTDASMHLVLDESFKTKKAPDLKLFLSPLSLEEIDSENALEGALLIAPLTSHKGAQRYDIPAGANLGDYKTLIIHCEAYSKLWGGASLE